MAIELTDDCNGCGQMIGLLDGMWLDQLYNDYPSTLSALQHPANLCEVGGTHRPYVKGPPKMSENPGMADTSRPALKVDRENHPNVKIGYGYDELVHVYDQFGDPWCDDTGGDFTDDDMEPTGNVPDPATPVREWNWCAECLADALDEKLLVPA
jgi:hypothetical protein